MPPPDADGDAALLALEPDVPVAMLPVRVETRFEGTTRLHVRIYPDTIHIDQHDETIGAAEVEIAKAYWLRYWSNPAAFDSAWRELAAAIGPERAAFLIDRSTPTNLAALETAPAPIFPDIATTTERIPVRALARLLPSRWCVTLIGHDGKRMVRRWTSPVPETLAVSPFGDVATSSTASADPLAIDDSARWMIDFKRALASGMALTIDQRDLEQGRLADGIARLVVIGVDWVHTPSQSAERLAEHLLGHQWSGGLAFVRPGTPSNNTSAKSSMHLTDARSRSATFPPGAPGMRTPGADVKRFVDALGIGNAERFANAPGGDLACERCVEAVHTALHGAALGFFLTEVMHPIVPASVAERVRAHVRDYVRPAGPLPTLKIDNQPYGILPILTTPVRFASRDVLRTLPGAFRRDLAEMLANIRSWIEEGKLNAYTQHALDQLVTMAAVPPGEKPEDVLATILKLGPVANSVRVRPIASTASAFVSEQSLEAAEDAHRAAVRLILSNVRGGLIQNIFVDEDGEIVDPKIFRLFAPTQKRYFLKGSVPWVASDLASTDAVAKAVAKVRERIDAAANDPNEVKRLLSVAAGDAETLFEALLMLSAAFEYWRAGEREVRQPPYQATAQTPLLTEMVAIEPPPPPRASGAWIDTPRQLLQLRTARVSADEPSKPFVTHIRDAAIGTTALAPHLVDAREFHEALDGLGHCATADVDHAMRGLLDLGSHRLDAWITSLATARLADLRDARPGGIYIGGYGFVHDLAADVTPDSEGHIHVPSIDHAITAAVLRSAHMANRDDAPDAFSIRLTSERVRDALHISEGIAQGQRAGALLGYRFERRLVDGRHQAKYIHAFRRLAPQPDAPPAAAGAQEATAARDVVDGQKLVELWRERRSTLLPEVAALVQPPLASMPPADATALTAELDRLVELFDAFLDLWTAESVFQLSRGNLDRAASALATIDRQERPPEPLAVQTPRKSWGYVQRIMWSLPADASADGWPEDIVANTEPGANALAAQLLGDPARFIATAHVVDATGAPVAAPTLAPLPIVSLGWSPLTLVVHAQASAGESTTALDDALLARFEQAATLPAGARIVLDVDAPPGEPTKVGLAGLAALLAAARNVIFDRRSVSQVDFATPSGVVSDNSATAVVLQRAAALEQELVAAEAALAAVIAMPTPSEPGMRQALISASRFVRVPPSHLSSTSGRAIGDLLDDVRAAHVAIAALVGRWKAIVPVPQVDASGSSQLTPAAQMEAAIERIRVVFGPAFPVLPPFSLEGALASELAATLGDQPALYAARSKLALVKWLRTLSLVRPAVAALSAALDSALWGGVPVPGSSGQVAQLPHVPGSTWAAMPFDANPPRDVRLSAVLFGEPPLGEGTFVGVLIDEWTEAIPETATMTSVAFHYDAPAQRPPQAICLAVNGGVSGERWSADALVNAVNELFDLARLRLLTPAQIPGVGTMLPMTFMPRNLSGEMPSFALFDFVEAAVASPGILGRV